jgi:hypothetical protein
MGRRRSEGELLLLDLSGKVETALTPLRGAWVRAVSVARILLQRADDVDPAEPACLPLDLPAVEPGLGAVQAAPIGGTAPPGAPSPPASAGVRRLLTAEYLWGPDHMRRYSCSDGMATTNCPRYRQTQVACQRYVVPRPG